MAEEVKLELTVLERDNFEKVVDTSFKTFTEPVATVDNDTVQELFRLFNKLFYSIPIYGPVGTLEELVTKSKELYQEADGQAPEIQPLLDEITDLRQRLLEANQQILLSSGTING